MSIHKNKQYHTWSTARGNYRHTRCTQKLPQSTKTQKNTPHHANTWNHMQKRAITCKNTQNTCTIAMTNFGHSRYTTRPCLRGGISKADAQEVPKRGHQPPKSEQTPVKWRPRERQTPPESISRRNGSTIFAGSSVEQAPGMILRCFVAWRHSSQYVSNIQKHRKNCGFCTCAFFSHCRPARTTKHRKKQFRTLQIVPGRTKIRPGATQNTKKTTKKCPEVTKRCPRPSQTPPK